MIQASSIRVKNASGTARTLVTDELRREFEHFWQEENAKDPFVARNLILSSICPNVYGMFIVRRRDSISIYLSIYIINRDNLYILEHDDIYICRMVFILTINIIL